MENYYSRFLVLFLILVAFTSYMESVSAARPVVNTEFIRTSCKSTTFPSLCISSLSSRATVIGESPQLIAHEALTVSLETTQSTSAMMVKLAHGQGMTPREVGAMRDCMEELGVAVDELRNSLREMQQLRGNNKDFGLKMNDIQTWVSAAMTDEDTCSEGFAGKVMNGNVKTVVRAKIIEVAHMTSNALALINSLAALHR